MEYMTLKGLVISKFGSVSEFARAIGWKAGKAGRLMRGETDLTVSDAVAVANILGIERPEDIVQIFFGVSVHKTGRPAK